MKKKTYTYILLFVVACIWGVIIYRILTYKSIDTNSNAPTQSSQLTKQAMQQSVYDTIHLQLSYADPFLKRAGYGAPVVASTENQAPVTPKQKPIQTTVVATPTQVKPSTIWPQLKYSGIIEVKEKKVGLLQINNQSVILALGKTEQDITLKRLYKDSIIVLYKNESKTIYKK